MKKKCPICNSPRIIIHGDSMACSSCGYFKKVGKQSRLNLEPKKESEEQTSQP